ncbi:MAG: hypothetical protein E7631_08205 [Ruminococcaceae bacterium]|nr:hypothetical protein [Oscillospiraceae bacterium]
MKLTYYDPCWENTYEIKWELAGALTHYHNCWGTGTKRLFLQSSEVPNKLPYVHNCLAQDVYLNEGDEFKLAKINRYGVWEDGMGFRTIAYKLNGDQTDAPGNDFTQGSEYDNIRVQNSGHYRIYLLNPSSYSHKIAYERVID